MALTEQQLIGDIMVALGVDIPKESTLETVRLEILGAIDRQAFFVECRDKENKFIRRKITAWRNTTKKLLKNPH